MSYPSRNFISYTAKWDEAPSQVGWSLFGDCHDVMNDTEVCYNYHNSIGLVLSSPPYGNDAISNTGPIMTVSDLENEITTLLTNFVYSYTWMQDCLIVFELGSSYDNDLSSITNRLSNIANVVENVWHLDTLTYTRSGRNQRQQSLLVIFSVGEEPPVDDVYMQIESLKKQLAARPAYSTLDAMFGQRRYRKILLNPKIRDNIRNQHQISPRLVNDIITCLGKGVVVDWYSGSNLVGAGASSCGFQWLATEKDPLQFLNQLARFEMFDYERLLANVGENEILPRVKQIPNVYRAWVSREFAHFLAGLAYENNCHGSVKALIEYQSSSSNTAQPAANKTRPYKTLSITSTQQKILEVIMQYGEYRYMEVLNDTRPVLTTGKIEALANITGKTLHNAQDKKGLLVHEAAPDLRLYSKGNHPVCWALTDKALSLLEKTKETV